MIGGSKEKITVLATDADRKNALAIVRCLAKKGYTVYCAGHQKQSMCFLSKYCSKKFIYTHPEKNTDDFVNDIEHIVKNNNIDILLPVSASATIPLSFHKKRLEQNVTIPISDYEIISKAHNKETMLKIAEKCNVPIPQTFSPKNIEEVQDLADSVTYPAVIKPRKSSASRGIQYVHSKKELLAKYPIYGEVDKTFDFSHPLIQEYIPGEIHDVCILANNGKTRAGLTQKRIWTYPVNGGGGVVNQTTDEPDLMKMAERLTKSLNWNGVTQVEFKIDSRNDSPKLMEANAKFWGTLELSIAAGICFPDLLCQLALDQDFEETFEYQKNLMFIWINAGFFSNFLQSDSLIHSLKTSRNFIKQKYETNISYDDIVPHVFLFRDFFKSLKDTIQKT
jgi:predicted ATP-grasp superfamily ATP-dependent carboligase